MYKKLRKANHCSPCEKEKGKGTVEARQKSNYGENKMVSGMSDVPEVRLEKPTSTMVHSAGLIVRESGQPTFTCILWGAEPGRKCT
jgi:hypothetical protein